MATRRQIKGYAQEIARQFKPRRIILFGSCASGKPAPDSDVDLLVIMPHKGLSADQATRIRLKVRAPFPMDLLVRSPQQIRQRLALGDWFIEDVLHKGEVLYEASHS